MRKANLPPKNNRLNAYLLDGERRYKPRKDREVIDIEQIKAMCTIGCTVEEIAAILGTSTDWLSNEKASNPALALAMEQGYSNLRMSLRRTQIELAQSGNATMLIWLGKQYLAQSDKQVVDNNTTISITVQKAMDELRNIPKDQLLSSRDMLRHHVKSEAQDVDFVEQVADGETPHPPVAV